MLKFVALSFYHGSSDDDNNDDDNKIQQFNAEQISCSDPQKRKKFLIVGILVRF